MSVYIYREDCGEFEARFAAADDGSAEAHAEAAFRDPANPDFDGDSAQLARIDIDEDGSEFEAGVVSFEGTSMIANDDGLRRC